MSQATDLAPTPQPQVEPTPASPTDKPTEEQIERAREQAEGEVKHSVRCVKTAESGYADGYLRSGYHASEAVRIRVAVGEKRSVIIQAVEGQLALWSSTKLDANTLIACYHAHRLLENGGVEPLKSGVKLTVDPAFAYGHYREAWSKLVKRVEKDTTAETWVLLPGLEEKCKAVFAECAASKLSRDACLDKVRELLGEFAKLEADRAANAQHAALSAQANADQLAAKLEGLQHAYNVATDDANKAELGKQIAGVQDELRAAQDAAKTAQKDSKSHSRSAQSAGNKASRRDTTQTPKNPPETGKQPTCVGAAKAAPSAKDVGQLLADMICECGKDPAEVLEALSASLDWSPKLGAAILRGMSKRESRTTALAMYNGLRAIFAGEQNGQLAKAV
jgi:hypothetical protein